MANSDRPLGLVPVRHLNGHPWNGKTRPYYVPAGDTNDMFIGDPVDIVGDANDNEVKVIGGKFAPGTLSEVALASAGDTNRITGVIVGIMPTTRDSTIYRSGSVETVLRVCDDPSVVFQVQDDAAGSLSVDTVGLNANLASGTGSTATGRSGWELDGDGTIAADSSGQLFILNLANIEEDNVAADGNAKWEVLINTHRYRDTGEGGAAEGRLGVA